MKTGVIKFFNKIKGYGYIKEDGTGVEIFLHVTGLSGEYLDEVKEGDRVAFHTIDGRKGVNAVEVRRI